MNGYVDSPMNGYVDGPINGYVDGPMNGPMDGPMSGHMTPHTPVPPGVPMVPPSADYPATEYPAPEYSGPEYNGAEYPATEYNGAMPVHEAPPTELIQPIVPDEPKRSTPVGEETTGSIRAKEIRSHRTGNKPAKREDDRTNTQELDRLLGFFDEIRRAKAWDEGPQEEPPHKRGGTRTATRKRR
jgi:hypothetical protein